MSILEILHRAKRGTVRTMELLYAREERPERQFWLMGATQVVFRTKVKKELRALFEDARKDLEKMSSCTLENRSYGMFMRSHKRKTKSQLRKYDTGHFNEDYDIVKESPLKEKGLMTYKNGKTAPVKYEAYSQRNHVQAIKCKLGEFIRGYKMELKRNESHKLPTLPQQRANNSKDWQNFINVNDYTQPFKKNTVYLSKLSDKNAAQ
eukprot:TRINITY_DN7590_c0_g2_i1.p1 TRINITY_DN7590_c0_g2~~TRINITY_DN7590_c0_g2_i1.p1  ORF type:complete len:207 (-),score=62.38 TRINITY_DN7590_c0_g2_i1:136-756(-)